MSKNKFDHDHNSCCTFLGHFNNHDLYFCPQDIFKIPTLIARYGNKGEEYKSGLEFKDTDSEIKEAYNRAKIAGFIK